MSPEEKASANWALQRASLQRSYQATLKPQDGPAQNVDSGNPVVNVLIKVLETLKASAPGVGGRYIKDFNDLKHLPLFASESNAGALQRAIQQAQQSAAANPHNVRTLDIST